MGVFFEVFLDWGALRSVGRLGYGILCFGVLAMVRLDCKDIKIHKNSYISSNSSCFNNSIDVFWSLWPFLIITLLIFINLRVRIWFNNLKRTYQIIINTHNSSPILKHRTIIWCREYRNKLPFPKKFIPFLNNLKKYLNFIPDVIYILNQDHFLVKMLIMQIFQIIVLYLFNYFIEILLFILLDLTIIYHIINLNLGFMLVDLMIRFFLLFLVRVIYHHAYIIFFIRLKLRLALC